MGQCNATTSSGGQPLHPIYPPIEIFSRVLAAYDVPRSLIAQHIADVRREPYAVWRESDLHVPRRGRLSSMLATLDVDTYRVSGECFARGRTLADLDLRRATGATVIARVRNGAILPSPGGDTTVEVGDTLVLLGTNQQLEPAQAMLEGRAEAAT